MKHSWSVNRLGVVLLSTALLAGCSVNAVTESSNAQTTAVAAIQSNESASASSEPAAGVDLTKGVQYEDDDYDSEWSSGKATSIKLDGAGESVDGSGATVKDKVITIHSAGTYAVSGKLQDGQIVIDVQDKGTVRLVLNGAEIHSGSGAPIHVQKAGKAVITLQKGTNNLVSDSASYVYPDASTDEPNSAIFSKADLTINGSGKLVVQANFNNGITSKDKLKITGGTLEIHAVDDGLMGRDEVAVQDGEITIESGGDGIKSTNDTDADKGFVAISGGTFNIKSGKDGIQAVSSIQINEGTVKIDSADDSIHGNGNISLLGGHIHIASGDDGIHADASIAISGGTIDIAKSYEGIESEAIMVSGGEVHVVSSDDGVNVAQSSKESATSGQGRFSASANNKLTISGGYLSVDAQGDGLDANSSIEMTGGTVIVHGPTANDNAPLDYDGTFEMTGGFLIAAGSSRMAQSASEQSTTQLGVMMTYSRTQAAGTLVHLQDSSGKAVLSFAPSKAYQSLHQLA
ncbi:MAG: dockerin type 1 [Paenibacillus sp.]|nr:dockerin type 1 [Paenibacillus sp.]